MLSGTGGGLIGPADAAVDAEMRRRGRPPKERGKRKRAILALRIRDEMKAALTARAAKNQRSMSEEAEALLGAALINTNVELNISRLDLAPNDILVIQTKERLPQAACERFREELYRAIGSDRKCLILTGDATLAVLTGAEIKRRMEAAPC